MLLQEIIGIVCSLEKQLQQQQNESYLSNLNAKNGIIAPFTSQSNYKKFHSYNLQTG